MKKASSLLVPALLLGLSAAIVQSCASGETDPAYSGGGSGGDSGDGDGGVSGDGSGGNASSSGGSNGTSSGGSPASSGGVTGSSSGGRVGSGGSSSTSSGGKTGSGGAKTGGTTGTSSGGKTGSGGTTTSGSGGMIITSSGGTTGSMTCTKQDATMTVNNGMATNGTWSGYAYTYVGTTPATISPDCSTSSAACFKTAAKQLCVSGSIGADPTFMASAGFGWDIGGTASSGAAGKGGSSSTSKPTIVPGGSGLAYNIPGITTSMRLQVTDGDNKSYCAVVPMANSGTIPWGMFTQQCYNSTPGTAYASTTKIASVQVIVPATSGSAAYPFCFCVVSLGPAT